MSNSTSDRVQQLVLRGELHDPQRQVADPLELGDDPEHRHDEAQVGGHRRLPAEQEVAALGERHVHGVDLVVGLEGQLGQRRVAGAEALAHPLEVLVDAHAHQLHLQAQLVELLAEPVPHGLDRLRVGAHPKRPVT